MKVHFIGYRRNTCFLLYTLTTYAMQQDAVLEFLRENDFKLSGDSRCDSTRYIAKYFTYSLMDSATDLILDYKLIQSSETGSSAVAMEREGLRRSLNYLLERNVSINMMYGIWPRALSNN